MAKVKNKTGGPWVDAWSGQRVASNGTLEIADELTYNYTQSVNWAPADKATQALHDAQKAAIEAAIVAAENPDAVDEVVDETPADDVVAAATQED